MIGIVDYGLGNITAFENIYRRENIPAIIVDSAQKFGDVDRLILPGVGAFDWAMGKLNDSGLREPLDRKVLEEGAPALGVCVGMQMMANSSDEGDLAGLGWIPGRVRRFSAPERPKEWRLPHMGWNDVMPRQNSPLFRGLEEGARFYFLHSYFFSPEDSESELSTTDYFGEFASTVTNDRVFGVQFHPEKSHQWGIRLLSNFAEL